MQHQLKCSGCGKLEPEKPTLGILVLASKNLVQLGRSSKYKDNQSINQEQLVCCPWTARRAS